MTPEPNSKSLTTWMRELTESGATVQITDSPKGDTGHRTLTVVVTPVGGEPRTHEANYSPESIADLEASLGGGAWWEQALIATLETRR